MHDRQHFDLDAGVDCLAFANTLDGRMDEVPDERLRSYADLVAFAEQTEQLDPSEGERLRQLAVQHPDAAQAVLERAIATRETIYRTFSAVAADRLPDAADLDALNAELHTAMAHFELAAGPERVEWAWQSEQLMLDRPLWPIVRSTADLLTSDETGRIRECAAHDCGWLFFDESRNRSRRWCSMQSCGNRAKVDRFRARQRGAQLVEEPAG